MKRPINRLLFGNAGTPGPLADFGLTILRVYAGLMMALGHGWGKLTDNPGPAAFISGVESQGFPVPTVSGWLAILGEFLGGLLLAIGLATRPAALWVLGVMAGAAFVVHGDSFTGDAPFAEAEMALLYFAIALAFAFLGSGRFGVDRFLRKG